MAETWGGQGRQGRTDRHAASATAWRPRHYPSYHVYTYLFMHIHVFGIGLLAARLLLPEASRVLRPCCRTQPARARAPAAFNTPCLSPGLFKNVCREDVGASPPRPLTRLHVLLDMPRLQGPECPPKPPTGPLRRVFMQPMTSRQGRLAGC